MLVGGHEGWGEIGDRLGIGNGLEMIGEGLGDWEWIGDDWRKQERGDKP